MTHDPDDLFQQQDTPARTVGWAHFSLDKQYRFALGRRWNHEKAMLCWLMMNPSTAGPTDDDATIRRVTGFTRSFGYGGFVVVNTTAYIATDSAMLPQLPPRMLQHPDNPYYQRLGVALCEKTVVAFGVPIKGREELARSAINLTDEFCDEVWALDVTKDGWPRHPLRLPGDLSLQRWTWPG